MPELIRLTAAHAINPMLFLAGMAVLYATGLLLLLAAAAKFLEHARHPEPLAKGRAHFFSTREMLIGVLVLFPFWLNSFGQLPLEPVLQPVFFAIGAAMIALAVIWHVAAKIKIRHMWSDGIEIKREHQLMTAGAYGLARHPMYASLLLWCWGGSLMMANGATLAITTLILLPLMIKRARDEERELLKVQPEYLLYQQNTPMLTPKLGGAAGMIVRILAAALFGFAVVIGLTPSGLVLIAAIHLYLGFCLVPAKVGFSYKSKSGMMVAAWVAALYWAPAYYFLYLVLAMFVYGLFFNCPCMIVYEKYHGCPCFGWVKSCVVPRKG